MSFIESGDVYACLLRIQEEYRARSRQSLEDVITDLAERAVEELEDHLTDLLFARCLIGEGEGSLDYVPTRLIWNRRLEVEEAREVAAGFMTFLDFAAGLVQQRRGGAAVQFALERSDYGGFADVLKASTITAPGSAECLDEGLVAAFREVMDRNHRLLAEYDLDGLGEVDMGQARTRPGLDDGTLDRLTCWFSAPDQEAENSMRLASLWSSLCGVSEFWAYKVPFTSELCPWGGMYFTFRSKIDDSRISNVKNSLGIIVNTIFLYWHFIDYARSESVRSSVKRQASALGDVRKLNDLVLETYNMSMKIQYALESKASEQIGHLESIGQLIPPTTTNKFHDRWIFRHDWNVDAIREHAEDYRAQFSSIVLALCGERLQNTYSPWDGVRPTERLREIWEGGTSWEGDAIADPLTAMPLLRAIEPTIKKVIHGGDAWDREDSEAFYVLKGWLHHPFKRHAPLTAPLFLWWLGHLKVRIDPADRDRLLRSTNGCSGMGWPPRDVMKSVESLLEFANEGYSRSTASLGGYVRPTAWLKASWTDAEGGGLTDGLAVEVRNLEREILQKVDEFWLALADAGSNPTASSARALSASPKNHKDGDLERVLSALAAQRRHLEVKARPEDGTLSVGIRIQ